MEVTVSLCGGGNGARNSGTRHGDAESETAVLPCGRSAPEGASHVPEVPVVLSVVVRCPLFPEALQEGPQFPTA